MVVEPALIPVVLRLLQQLLLLVCCTNKYVAATAQGASNFGGLDLFFPPLFLAPRVGRPRALIVVEEARDPVHALFTNDGLLVGVEVLLAQLRREPAHPKTSSRRAPRRPRRSHRCLRQATGDGISKAPL